MPLLRLLFYFALVTGCFADNHFRIAGYLIDYRYSAISDVDHGTIEELLFKEIKISQADVDEIREHGRERGSPTVNFRASISTSLTRYELVEVLRKTEHVKAIGISSIDEFPARTKRAATQTATGVPCQNDGILLSNNTCQCLPFTSGTNCGAVSCKRFGIEEQGGTRCYCPPGWYGQHCEIRGCRPPVEDNLAVDNRALVVVIPMVSTMNDEIQSIANNIKATIATLNANEAEDGTGDYITTFVTIQVLQIGNSATVVNPFYYTDIDAFVQSFKDAILTVTPNNFDLQPLLRGIEMAQTKSRSFRPYSLILVFSDRGDVDGGPPTFKTDDNTEELRVAQLSLLWRSRVYFFITQSSDQPINTTADSYDTYRRVATYTHGELFLLDRSEITTILTQFVTRLYKPEYLDVVSYSDCSSILLNTMRDQTDQIMTILVTVDKNSASEAGFQLLVENAYTLPSNSSGKYWKMYTMPTQWMAAKVVSSPGIVCSVRSFVSSKSTWMSAFNDFTLIDAGNGVSLAGAEMYVTGRTASFPPYDGIQFYQLYNNNNIMTTDMVVAGTRSQECTFDWLFTSNRNCVPGPFTQKYIFRMLGGGLWTRTYPALCIEPKYHPGESAADNPPPAKPATADTICYQQNINDIAEPRLRPFRQVIFVLEVSEQMSVAAGSILNYMNSLLQSIDSDNQIRYYTLITFDMAGTRGVISDYDANAFYQKFQKAFIKYYVNTPNHLVNQTYSLDAVIQATKLYLVSPAIIHVFASVPPIAHNQNWVLPTDVQVNVYFVNDGRLMPVDSGFRIVQKQTGGRLLPISKGDVDSLEPLLLSSVYENNLVFDDAKADCSTSTPFYFAIEKAATKVVLTLVGAGLYNVTILDGKANRIALNDQKLTVQFTNNNTMVVSIDSTKTQPGIWYVYVTDYYGPCYVQARVISPVNVALGFMSDPSNDFVAKHPFVNRGSNPLSYGAVRFTDDGLGGTSFSNIVVQSISFDQPWLPNQQTVNVNLTRRDNSCTWQYRTNQFNMIRGANSLKVTVNGVDSAKTPIARTFFYYTPTSAGAEVCSGGTVNTFGECVCPYGYEGEFCYTPRCVNGGTACNGICMCTSGYIGTFCDEPMIGPGNTSIRTTGAYTTTTSATTPTAPQATTKMAILPNQWQLFSYLVILCLV